MKIDFLPSSRSGKWSVGLNTFFLIVIAASCVLVLILRILNFDDHWWDVTVAVSFPVSIIALITGIVAVRKYDERSVLVYLSIEAGASTLFLMGKVAGYYCGYLNVYDSLVAYHFARATGLPIHEDGPGGGLDLSQVKRGPYGLFHDGYYVALSR